eukprot:gene19830-26518_t
MRRSVANLLLQTGTAQKVSSQGANATPELMRHLSGGAPQTTPETPLSKIMPSVVTIPRQIITTAISMSGKLLMGAATSGSLVGTVAKSVVIDEKLVKIEDLDPSFWAYWLSTAGYSGQPGFKKLAEAAKSKIAGMGPEQISNLVVGLKTADYYDKDVFSLIAANISDNFTKFETEQLLKIVDAFAFYEHYSVTLFDDIADSITYANHYLAPIKVPTSEVAAALAAFAKFKHERADLLLTLSRGISEVGLSKLTADARKEAVVQALRALDSFNFYPEQVDALLYYANAEAANYSADEMKDVHRIQWAVEAQSGGKLSTYVANHEEDSVHWYGHHNQAPASYDLYVFRDKLVPSSYSPATMRSKQ